MQITYKNNNELKEIFSTLEKLGVSEARLNIDTNAISITETNNALTMLFDIKFLTNFFENYKLENNKTLTIDTKELSKVLKNIKKNALVEFSDDKELLIKAYNDFNSEFKISLLENEEKEKPNLENLNFTSNFTITCKDFIQMIKSLEETSEEKIITITTDKQGLTLKNDKNVINVGMGQDIIRDFEGEAKSTYSAELLKKLTNIFKLFYTIQISYASDHPIRFNMVKDGLQISIYLAPRIIEE